LSIILHELQRIVDVGISGDVVEFGCYVGTTSVPMAKQLKNSGRTLYVYDSFEGLPEKTNEDKSPAGEQFRAGELRASKQQFIQNFKKAGLPLPIIKKGWFDQLSDQDIPSTIAFAFLDADYYRSVKDPLLLISPHMSLGSTIIIDDYANEALPGAARAVDEWILAHDHSSFHVEHSLAIIHL
ncbi:MAG TPA: TylF/MycF/NovP-related O-methyltransferase, partial [Candidatus Saccharibacteria bacterium]|nr:TylF/MycF/NovP-related O-methyltransferase [Candidatus Saccharibacteria bacterium]